MSDHYSKKKNILTTYISVVNIKSKAHTVCVTNLEFIMRSS